MAPCVFMLLEPSAEEKVKTDDFRLDIRYSLDHGEMKPHNGVIEGVHRKCMSTIKLLSWSFCEDAMTRPRASFFFSQAGDWQW